MENEHCKKIILGTQLNEWPTARLERFVSRFSELVTKAHLAKDDYKLLILILSSKIPSADRSREKKDWEDAVTKISPGLPKPILIYDFEYIQKATITVPWNILHRNAFEDHGADVFCYIDPHVPNRWHKFSDGGEKIKANLADLIEKACQYDYVIGDYTPVPVDNNNYYVVAAKKFIEEVVKQKFTNCFSSALKLNKWQLFTDLKRLRSEFYAISKRLYNELKSKEKIVYDYGLQMLIVARFKEMNIYRLDIGNIPETGSFNPLKVEQQIDRVDFQLSQIQGWIGGW